jgi:hypothetical protein
LSEDAAPGPIRLALGIEDPALADRLAALLAGVPGLRLVGATEAADAAVVPFTAVSPSPPLSKTPHGVPFGRQAVTFSCCTFTCAPRGASNGGPNMALRRARYIAEHNEPAEMELEGEIREFVSRDVVSNVGRRPENESELVASNINSVLQRVTATSLQEIDALISELESSRDMLHSEAARVQREIVQYSTLIQGALHSTKIIAESLTQWKKVPDAQTLSD